MKLSLVGLGKLGAPMAAVFARKGYTVVGVDTNPEVVRAINEGRAPVAETGLAELIAGSRGRLAATTSHAEAVAATDATFIVVPTPSEAGGSFSLRHVLATAEAIGRALARKTSEHLVVLSSTVMPGSTEGEVLPVLERASGRRVGEGLGLCSSPEFIALGSVISDMLQPDLVLIGESDEESGERLVELYRSVCENRPHIARMNFVNAELTKLAVNTFVTTKISYANMLAQICERLASADVDVVTAALGCDSRVGGKYLKGALGYGGPCFPRDNLALSALARQHGVEASLAVATDQLNRRQAPRLAELLLEHLPPGGTIGVLGLSYKAGTDVVEEAQGMALIERLLAARAAVVAYDPAGVDNARRSLKGKVRFAGSARECVRESHVVAITTPWEEFQRISPQDLNRSLGRPTVVDCWRILPRGKFIAVANYLTLGAGPVTEGKKVVAWQA